MAIATNVIIAVPPWVAVEEPRLTGTGETPRLESQTPAPVRCERSRMSLRRSAGELPDRQATRRLGRPRLPGDVGLARCRQTGPRPNEPGSVQGWINGLTDARRRQGRRPPPRTLRSNFHRPEFLAKRLKKIERLLRSVMLMQCCGKFCVVRLNFVKRSCPLHPYMV